MKHALLFRGRFSIGEVHSNLKGGGTAVMAVTDCPGGPRPAEGLF